MATKYSKRPDGRYQTRIAAGKDENGKTLYKYLSAHSCRELDQKVAQIRNDVASGRNVISGDTPFSVWAERFLNSRDENGRNHVYMLTLKSRVLFWASCFGDTPISSIVASDIQRQLDTLARKNPTTGKPSARKTLIGYADAAAGVFALAKKDRAIAYDPTEYVSISKEAPEKRRRALNKEEQQWILTTPHRAQTAAMIMMLAGLRRGELLALRWSDVDLKKNIIHVRQSVEMVDGQPKVKSGGKTANAVRDIPIPPQLAKHLSALPEKNNPFSLVCQSVSGKAMSDMAFRRMWESYQKELNFQHGVFTNRPKSKFDPSGVPMVIEPITAHMLRHTYATNLYLSGVDVYVAKELLGHADIKTTLGIYTHLSEEFKDRSVQKYLEYLQSIG